MKKTVKQCMFAAVALIMLPACDWFSKPGSSLSTHSDMNNSSDQPLICFGAKTVMSVDDFRKKLKTIQESQPGLDTILGSMPEQEQLKVYTQLAEGCVSEQLVRAYITDKGLDQTAEYKALEKQIHEAVDGNIRMNEFQKELAREVTASVDTLSDAELRAYYAEHREKDPIFKREPFMIRSAKEDKGTPSKYADFDTPGVKEALKQVLQQAKFGELFQTKMEELKNKYGARVEMSCLQEFVVKQSQKPQADATSEPEEQSAAVTPRQTQAV